MMPARRATGPILVLLLLAAIGLPCGPVLGHPLPIEHEELVELEAGFDSFQVLDSYDGFLRGSTGEFVFIVTSLYEEGHKEASGELDKLVENVSGGFIYCLEPPVREQDSDDGCVPQVIFTHQQCHSPRTLHVELHVWEDDGDSETMAAIRALLKQSARVATGAADEIARSLADQILEISGLRDVVDEWLKGLEDEIRDQLGDDVGAIVNLIVSLAIDRAFDGGYAAADEALVELSDPVRREIDGLGRKLGLTDQARHRLLEGGHSILDWALDGVIDILIGAGNDPVGSYEGPLLEDWHPEARQARYGGDLHTSNFDLSEETGAELKFFVTANQSGGRFGGAASGAKVCPRPVERQNPLAPIEVGPRDEVGKKTLGEKATEQVVGGVLGRFFGGGSRRSSRSQGPRTRRDPSRKLDYVEIAKPELGLAAEARSRWTDDGLLVSTRIAESDDKGTFQTIFLQDCRGRRLYPSRIEIYDLWAEHRLTVSWSRTTTVNGRVTSHETGGWTDTWTEDLGTFTRGSREQEQAMPAIWQALGYDRAQAGVRQMGSYFNLTPEELAASRPLGLFAHATRPEQDPVITEPFHWIMTGEDDDHPSITIPPEISHDEKETEPGASNQWPAQCDAFAQAALAGAPPANVDREVKPPPTGNETIPAAEPDTPRATDGEDAKINETDDEAESDTASDAPKTIECKLLECSGLLVETRAIGGGEDDWTECNEGQTVVPGSEISTGFDSQARLACFIDGELVWDVTLKELTTFNLTSTVVAEGPAPAKPDLHMDVEYGEIDLDIKTREYNSDSTISTPYAVSSVRGTRLRVRTNRQLDQVELFEGAIEITPRHSGDTYSFEVEEDAPNSLVVTTDGRTILEECLSPARECMIVDLSNADR